MAYFTGSLFEKVKTQLMVEKITVGSSDQIRINKLPSHLRDYAKDLIKNSDPGVIFWDDKEEEIFDITIEYPRKNVNDLIKKHGYKQVVK